MSDLADNSIFTGERVIPGLVEPDLWNEHIARYRFAQTFTARKSVLDVGCGAGYGAALLSRDAAFVVGFDVAADAIRYASANYSSEVKVLAASASAFPFQNSCFDVVTAFEVIEHIAAWQMMVEEAARVLTSEGVFIVSTPNKSYYAETRKDVGANPFHVHEFEYSEFLAALSATFPFVHILAQNLQQGILFADVDDGAPSGGSAFLASSPTLPDAHFFVAVCAYHALRIPPFAFFSRAGNLLRERERHISALQSELADVYRQRGDLLEAHEKVQQELESHNRWALSLDAELEVARKRIGELEAEVQKQTAAARSPYRASLWFRLAKRLGIIRRD